MEEKHAQEQSEKDEQSEDTTQVVQQPVQLDSAMDTESDEDEDLTIEDKHRDEVTRQRARELLKRIKPEQGGE